MRGRRPHTVGMWTEDVDDQAPALDRRLLARLWRYIRPHRALLYLAVLMLPVAAGFNLVQPYLVKLAVDEAIVPRALDALGPLVGAFIAAVLLERLARFGEVLLLQLCGQRAMHDLRTTTHGHLLRLHARFFDRRPVGKLMTRVTNDVESITEAFSMGLVSVVGDVLTMAGIAVAMISLSPRFALLSMLVVPLLVVVVRVFRRLIRAGQRVIRRRVAQINGVTQEHITGMSVVQIFGREARSIAEFDEANRGHRDGYLALIRYDSGLYAVVELLGSLTVAFLLWYGGIGVLDDTLTFGLLVAFIEYVQKFFIPIRDMSVKYMAMQQAMAAAERVFELQDHDDLDGQGAPAPPRGAALEAAPRGHVVFHGVSFSYGNEPVLRDLSFTVGAGERVAIVGATGAGKSTIARLLVRLYDVDGGAILLGREELRRVPLQRLRGRVVSISQDVVLYRGTVARNITLDDPRVSEASARNAAARIGLDERMALDRAIGEGGSNLSAGERQLVAFARALARDPEVLVLDEATSSVDPETERLVQRGTVELMEGRTSIVIAHRLSTIERVDRIIVLHGGRVSEQGSHQELLAAGGIYARLYELQYVHQGRR